MGKIFNISLAVFAALGSFLFGYDAGVMTDVINSPNFLKYFNTDPASNIIGAINSVFSGGAVFGSLMGGFTMDRFGRKKTIQTGALICTVGAILQSSARNLAMILVGRIIAGWAVGLLSMSVPVYQAECAHPKIRGLIVGLAQQMIGIGFIVSSWLGYGARHFPDSSSAQWRFPLAFQAVPSLILMVGMLFFPESPRHLVEKDRHDEAFKTLNRLHYNGRNGDWIASEFAEIKATIAAEKAITVPGWKIMFTVPEWRTRLLHGTAVQVFTQLTGINVIGYYQTIIYTALGITGHTNVLVAGIYNIVGPITNFIFITFFLDRVGRKKPLIYGAAGITICLIIQAALSSQNLDGTRHGFSIGSVFFLFLVSIIFSMSFGPISWVYMSEVMPMQIRARGNAFATGIGNWLVSTLFAQVSPIGLGQVGWKYFFVFVAFNICVTIPVVAIFFKETKQKSLEEIDLLFGGRALGTLPENLADKEGTILQDIKGPQVAGEHREHGEAEEAEA